MPPGALIPFRRGSLWGYADPAREVVIPCAFEQTFPFGAHSVAHVRRDGKSGLIDRAGALVLPVEYTWIGNPYEGYLREPDGTLCLEKEGRFGFASADGALLVEAVHEDLDDALAAKGPVEHPPPPAPPPPPPAAPAGVGVAYAARGTFAEDRLPVADAAGLWGYLDAQGREVIPPTYAFAGPFEDGLALVGRLDEAKSAPLRRLGLEGGIYDYGFIDPTGREVIPLRYRLARSFDDGLAWVEDASGQGGYVDRRGVEYFEDA